MTVADIMTREVVTCRKEDALDVPARLMWEHDCGCIPVVDDNGSPIGIVTDRDICMAAYTTGSALGDLRVDHAMSKSLHTCAPTDSIADAEDLMRSNQIRRVPAVADGQVVGIVSLNDIALAAAGTPKRGKKKEITAAEVSETLAAVCVHRGAFPARIESAARGRRLAARGILA
jgi:CBS domain-containing protein